MVKPEWRGDTGPNKGSPLIYDLLWECSAAFSNTVHESSQRRADAVNRVAEVMSRTRAVDIGLASDTTVREIEFVEIADFPQYTVGVFLVPKGRKLPLHDHPGMTVMSKVLFGSINITSFDKVDYSREVSATDYSIPIPTIIRCIHRHVTCEDACEILHSTCDGNLHEFLATEDVAILDILTPPYNFESGRPCTYYRPVGAGPTRPQRPNSQGTQDDARDAPCSWPVVCFVDTESNVPTVSAGETAWLLATKAPLDFYTQRREYNGPPLDPSLTNLRP